ncbi:MAG: TolB protein [Thermoleophilales bacterium]|nr:TolB protein [Thermoleophilales bacterium]
MRRYPTAVATAAIAEVALAPATADATYPGREGRIAFSPGSSSLAGKSLYTAKPDGSDRRELAPDASGARWSANGKLVAWSGFDGVYVANADGSNARKVSDVGGTVALSPDGATLVGSRTLPANPDNWSIRPDLVAVDLATGQERLVAYDAVEPTFSPDGKRVAFVDQSRQRYRYRSIGVVGLDGKGRRLVYRGGAAAISVDAIDWSPSGASIAFVQSDRGQSTSLSVVTLRSGGVKRLRRAGRGKGSLGRGVSWSPTGKRLAVGSWDGNRNYELLLVTTRGRATKVGRKGQAPSWQPLR